MTEGETGPSSEPHLSGSTPLPSRPPHAMPRGRLGLLIGGGMVLAASLGAWGLLAELRRLQRQQVSLESHRVATESQLRDLTAKHAELTRTHGELAVDRDNVLAQLQRVHQEQEQSQVVRRLLEDVVKRMVNERLSLLNRIRPLEEQLVELQRSQERMLKERRTLERELSKAKGRVQEQQLREQLAKLRQDHGDLRRVLRETKRELQTLSRQESKATGHLTTLTKRLDQLQQEYANEVSENATLRRQVERLPTNVTSLAREHERLSKDLADTHYNMGVMFSGRRDYVRAAKEFRQVIELRPNDADAHYNLGLIYTEHLPDRGKATSFFRKYLALNPRGRDASWAKQYIAGWQAWEAEERLE